MNGKMFWPFRNSTEKQKNFIKNQTNKQKKVGQIVNLCCKRNKRNLLQEFARQRNNHKHIVEWLIGDGRIGEQRTAKRRMMQELRGRFHIIHIYYTKEDPCVAGHFVIQLVPPSSPLISNFLRELSFLLYINSFNESSGKWKNYVEAIGKTINSRPATTTQFMSWNIAIKWEFVEMGQGRLSEKKD